MDAYSLTVEQYRKKFKNKKPGKKQRKTSPSLHIGLTELPPGVLEKLNLMPGSFIFIPGEVYSSKNHKQIWKKNADPKALTHWKFKHYPVLPFITDSEPVKLYKEKAMTYYQCNAGRFRDMITGLPLPVYVEFTFIRRTKGRWDFNNMTQLVQDMMVKSGWLLEDNSNVLLPVPPLYPRDPYIVDRRCPGVVIRVIK